ncbi:MAG: adh 1 [Frankiales bacterium]|nr:adh 1 [Frankiales bacterium]
MTLDLQGARVLLTGASTGIGADLAVALGRRGATLGLVARRAELLDDVLHRAIAAGAGSASRRWAVDLSDLDAAQECAEQAWQAFDGVEAFVSNAALQRRRSALRLQAPELEEVTRVNFLAPARMTLSLVPRMLERGRGTVVLVGSVAGRLSSPGEAAYVASKHALAGFAETLACDAVGTPLVVRLVTPGAFDTPIWDIRDDEPTYYSGPKAPASLASDTIVAVLEGTDRFETYVPETAAQSVRVHDADVDAWVLRMAAMAGSATETP